jgi:hypothetical protein
MKRHYSLNYTAALNILGLLDTEQSEDGTPTTNTRTNTNTNTNTVTNTGTGTGTGIQEIEQAYRRLARVHHPDRGGDETSFILLTAAKDMLVNGNGGATCMCMSNDSGSSRHSPFHWNHDHDDGGGGTCSHGDGDDHGDGSDPCNGNGNGNETLSRILMRGRSGSCVRDLATRYDPSSNSIIVIAATDDGLKMKMVNGGRRKSALKFQSESQSQSQSQEVKVEFDAESVLCCALSSDGRFVFAGNAKGQVRRYLLKSTGSDSDSEMPLDNLASFALGQKRVFGLDVTKNSVVSVDVSNDSTSAGTDADSDSSRLSLDSSNSHSEKKNQHIVIAACARAHDSPTAVTMFRFKSKSVETLWRWRDTDTDADAANLLDGIHTIDTLMLSESLTLTTNEKKEEQHSWNIWLGGSNSSNEATLMKWEICLNTHPSMAEPVATCTNKDEGEDWWWSDCSSDSEDETECDMEMYAPRTMSKKLGFGSIYNIDECPDLRLLAATVGSDVVLLEPPPQQQLKDDTSYLGEHSADGLSFRVKNTLTARTNHVLYCVKILAKSLQIAAGGAGESIIIWSLARGTVQQSIRLNSLKRCNLSTNCIMSLDWLHVVDEEEAGAGTSIVSGGYDGNVTQWFIDARCNERTLATRESG